MDVSAEHFTSLRCNDPNYKSLPLKEAILKYWKEYKYPKSKFVFLRDLEHTCWGNEETIIVQMIREMIDQDQVDNQITLNPSLS